MPDMTSPTIDQYKALYARLTTTVADPQPLTGQPVCIPVSNKAFVEGRLQPHCREPLKSEERELWERELVTVTVGKDERKEMTRGMACEWILCQLRKMGCTDGTGLLTATTIPSEPTTTPSKPTTTPSKPTTTPSKPTATPFKLTTTPFQPTIKPFSTTTTPSQPKKKVTFTNSTKKPTKKVTLTNSTKKPTKFQRNEKISNETPSLACMDIHEEYNAGGQEVKGEATNLTSQWQEFQRTKLGKSVEIDTLEVKEENVVMEEEKVGVSNERYEEMARRLEQLEKLEVEHETTGEMGKGWKKGFLTGKKKKSVSSERMTSNQTKALNQSLKISTQPLTVKDSSTTLSPKALTVKDSSTTLSPKALTVKDNSTTLSSKTLTVKDNSTTLSSKPLTVKDNSTTLSSKPLTVKKYSTTLSSQTSNTNKDSTTLSPKTSNVKDECTTVSFDHCVPNKPLPQLADIIPMTVVERNPNGPSIHEKENGVHVRKKGGSRFLRDRNT